MLSSTESTQVHSDSAAAQPLTAPDGAAAGTAPDVGGAEATHTGTEPVTPVPTTTQQNLHNRNKVHQARKATANNASNASAAKTLKTKSRKASSAPAVSIEETTTTVAISTKSQFSQSIIHPPAIDVLFGMNDLDYVLDNYSDAVEALEDHFNRPGRPEATRATWGDLSFDAETLKYIDDKFGYWNKFFLNFRRRLKKFESFQTCDMKGTA